MIGTCNWFPTDSHFNHQLLLLEVADSVALDVYFRGGHDLTLLVTDHDDVVMARGTKSNAFKVEHGASTHGTCPLVVVPVKPVRHTVNAHRLCHH